MRTFVIEFICHNCVCRNARRHRSACTYVGVGGRDVCVHVYEAYIYHLLSCPTSQSHPCAIADIEVIASKSEHILEGLAPYTGAGGAEGGGPRVCVGVVTGRASAADNNTMYALIRTR